jgi:L-fucose isomerase-like protein
MKNLKIGIVSLAQLYNTDRVLAGEMYELLKEKIGSLPHVEIVAPKELIITLAEAKEAAALLKENQIDLLIVQNGTFSSGEVFMHLVQSFPGYIVLWGMPEPAYCGEPLKFNSLCGMNMNSSMLANMGRPFKYFYASPEDPQFYEDFERWLKVFRFYQELKETKIGLFGARTPGFFTFGLNELSLRKNIGPEVYHVDLFELFQEADTVSEEEVKRFSEEMSDLVCNCQDIPHEKSDRFARTYVAFRNIIERYELSAVAVKCWPEFINDYGVAVCSTMAKLVDDRIMAGCEGDILGTITSLAQLKLSGEVPFIADLVNVDLAENTGTMWHCGCAPYQLAHPKCPPRLGQDFGIGGLTAEFDLKPGRVTVARLSILQDKYRLLVTTGEAIDTLHTTAGTAGIVKFDCDAQELLDKFIYGGFEHHLGMVYADIKDELIELGRLLHIETIVL